jgi:hypothetical protein
MRNRRKWNGMVVAAVVVALILAAGCSNIEQAISNTEQNFEDAEEAFGDAEKGEVTITREDGRKITLSSKPDIPDLFPSDIPLPDEMEIISTISSDDSVTLGVETEMPYDEIVKLYFDYAQDAGYTEVHKLEDEKFINYSTQKGTERFIFTFQLNLEDNKTVYGSLIYSNKPESEQ